MKNVRSTTISKKYQNIRKIFVNTKLKKTGHLLIVFLLSIWWATTTSYFAFTTPIGNPPDEIYHIKLAEQYKPVYTIIANDSQDTIKLGIISKSPNLYHLLLGKLLNLTSDNDNLLRSINFLLGLCFFFLCLKVINQHSSDHFVKTTFLFLITNSIMLQYIFGAVSYDNLVNLFALYSFYLFFQIINNYDTPKIRFLILISLLAILVKPTYLPLFVIQFIFVLTHLIQYNLFTNFVKKSLTNIFFLTTLICLSSIILYFYGTNLINYKTISPSCNQIFSQFACKNNPDTIQNDELTLKTKIKPSFSNIYSYFTSWIILMTERTFGVFSHKSILPDPNWISLLTIAIIFSFTIIFKLIDNRYDYYLFFISAIYISTLFFTNFNGYLNTGITHIAIQGRYLFPVIFAFYYLFSKYINRFLHSHILKLLFLCLIICYLSQYGFFYFIRVQDFLKFLKIT